MPWKKRIVSIRRHGHICHQPFIWLWIKVGSIWQCECGSNYVVFKYPTSGLKSWRQIL